MTMRSPVPIGLVLRTFEPGGTERQMIELIRRLDPARWRVHVACFRAQGEWFGRAVEAAASITEFPVRSFLGAEAFRHGHAFGRWCRERRLSIVQTTGLPTNLFGLPAAAAAGVPIRLGARREINANRTPLAIAAQRVAYGCATGIIANSQAAAARLRRERVPAGKVTIVPNGLDVSAFVGRSPLSRSTPRRAPRIVVVIANLRREKRHDVLIDAAPSVVRAFPDARFLIVGNGPERSSLEARTRARGVSHAFEFTGHDSNVAARLESADIFVLPSESEGFPNAVLEAMAAGLTIVASDLPALREIVTHEEDGLLVSAGDANALADALCRVMQDGQAASRMGERARESVCARFSFDRMVSAFEAIYLRELSRLAPPPRESHDRRDRLFPHLFRRTEER